MLLKPIFVFLPFLFATLAMLFFVKVAVESTRAKALWAAALFFGAAKFLCFALLGGDSFTPELPAPAIWAWNWAYSGMCILCGLSVVLLPFRCIARKILLFRLGRIAWLAGLPALAWGAAAVGVWNGIKPPDVREIELSFENLPPSLDGYRIVHITDMHASAAAPRWRTAAIVERANALDADLICLTGDYADGMSSHQGANIEPIAALKAKDGVLAVCGNHEYYFDTDGWFALYRRLGIRFLENGCVFPRKGLAVAGVPDSVSRHFKHVLPDPDAAVAPATNGEFRILLQHRPFEDYQTLMGRDMKERFDLQLSGHTHGGVAPGMAMLVGSFNAGMVKGIYKREDGGTVYVSNGSGQWAGFPIRFFNDPEIALIILRKK
jgi:hypothetical protein